MLALLLALSLAQPAAVGYRGSDRIPRDNRCSSRDGTCGGLVNSFLMSVGGNLDTPLASQCSGAAFLGFPQAAVFTRSSNVECEKSDGTVTLLGNNAPSLERFGWKIEGAGTNLTVAPRDLTNAAWVKTTMSAALNATGVDGVASSASTLTASAANGTALQTLTAAAARRNVSAYVKRGVGTGSVFVTADAAGAGYSDITASLSTTVWRRLRSYCGAFGSGGGFLENCIEVNPLSNSVLNPAYGFKIATNGDSIIVDMVQDETGDTPTSPMPSFARAAADLLDSTSVLPFDNGTTGGEVSVDVVGEWYSNGISVYTPWVFDTSFLNANAGLYLYTDNSNGNLWMGSTKASLTTSNIAVASGTSQPAYYNFRVTFGAGNIGVWVNGLLKNSGSALNVFDGHGPLHIGNERSAAYFNGWISQMRWRKGVYGSFHGGASVTLVGDSIVDGSLVPAFWSRPPQVLQASIGGRASEKYVTSTAVGGYTMTQCQTAWNGALAGGSVDARPKTMVLQCGINSVSADTPAVDWAMAQAMLNAAIADGIKVCPATITVCTGCVDADITSFNNSMKAWGTANNVPVADTYSALKSSNGVLNPAYDSGDGEHPNAAGSAVIVQTWQTTCGL